MTVTPGLYRHFKGALYRAVETLTPHASLAAFLDAVPADAWESYDLASCDVAYHSETMQRHLVLQVRISGVHEPLAYKHHAIYAGPDPALFDPRPVVFYHREEDNQARQWLRPTAMWHDQVPNVPPLRDMVPRFTLIEADLA